MIGLVFSRPPKAASQETTSWWCGVPREQWSSAIAAQVARWVGQKASEEPTAKKIRPRWQQRWKRSKDEAKV